MDAHGVILNTPGITAQRLQEQSLHMLSGLYSSCKKGHYFLGCYLIEIKLNIS